MKSIEELHVYNVGQGCPIKAKLRIFEKILKDTKIIQRSNIYETH